MKLDDDIETKYMRKVARTDQSVAEIVGNQVIPKFCRVRQEFVNYKLQDVAGEVRKKLQRPGTLEKVKPGQSIAITAGSRGVANISTIIKTVADEIKRIGGKPFIVPAMGSHGGATAEGQLEILTGYNITEESMGCPIRSSMGTVQVGVSVHGKQVRIDKNAAEADGIIIVGRVKPHTAFTGKYESGLVKMITIGLGKQVGAEICHSDSFKYMEQNITSIAKVILDNRNILFGVATVESAFEETARIEVIPAEKIFDEEPALLIEARKNMPSILLGEFDVMIVDEVGKNISGDGMDPNITGTFATPYASGGAKKQRTVVLDLSEETHGNGMGLGMADYSVQRAYDKMDFEKTYPNALTSTIVEPIKIPMILANDRLAVQAAIKTCNMIDYDHPKIVRIKNSLKMDEIYISEALLNEAKNNPRIEILDDLMDLTFDKNGNLF